LKTFLDQVIDLINNDYDDISKVVVILPSKRSCLFLKERLIQNGLRSSWLPKIITLNQFVEALFPGQIENSLTILTELYKLAEKLKLKEADTFEEFYRWGEVLLRDFNTIESYGVNGKDLYKNLKDIEVIERWSFANENLTPNQIAFNDFWMNQGVLYEDFTQMLKKQNRASGAMALRWVADNNEEALKPFEKNDFIIAGFNALSISEQKLIAALLKIGHSYFLPDTDRFFVNGNKEAGYFYRQLIKKYTWKGIKDIPDNFASSAKKMEMISVTQRSAIALVCSQLLKEKEDLSNTAIVLGDESMLESLITSLPENIGPINITMGYKLRNTPAYDLFLSFYSIQLRIKKKGNEIYHKDLIRFLNHPYIAQLFGEKFIRELKKRIVNQNLIYIAKKHLQGIDIPKEQLALINNFLFFSWKSFPKDPNEQLLSFVDAIQAILNVDTQALDLEYLFHFKKIIHQLSIHIESYTIKLGLSGYKVLFGELLKSNSISFQGEPLEGLQIMGLLESRTLDFEHVILLNVNEGLIPKTTLPQSFIPWDLRKYFGLPGKKEQDSLYAYYFYRLIQRASDVSFIYNTNSGKDLKSAEASRYLRQLDYYNTRGETNFIIKQYQTKLDHLPKAIAEIKLKRNAFYKERLIERMENGLSPTALSTYLNCPLDFYFKYILGLREDDEIDEEMGADVLGNIIHIVLEDLYKPYIGNVPDFSKIRANMDLVLRKVISEKMKNRWIKTGINQMNIQIIETLLDKFLKLDQSFIEEQIKNKNKFEIVKLEEGLNRTYEMDMNGDVYKVKIKGFADRIDRINNQLRIIDYKTGKVDKLKNVEVEKVFTDSAWSKGLQLLMYQAMYDNFNDPSLEVGIIGFRDLGKYFQKLQLKKADKEDVSDLFLAGLEGLLKEMLFDDKEIIHNPKSKWCKFCELH
jgi:hypothetical protein